MPTMWLPKSYGYPMWTPSREMAVYIDLISQVSRFFAAKSFIFDAFNFQYELYCEFKKLPSESYGRLTFGSALGIVHMNIPTRSQGVQCQKGLLLVSQYLYLQLRMECSDHHPVKMSLRQDIGCPCSTSPSFQQQPHLTHFECHICHPSTWYLFGKFAW